MKNTLETNLPKDDNTMEENPAQVTPETEVAEEKTEDTITGVVEEKTGDPVAGVDEEKMEIPDAEEPFVSDTGRYSKDEIISKIAELLENVEDSARNEIDSLKQLFYKIRRGEVDSLKNTFIEEGGDEKDFVAPDDESESKLKALLTVYREKKATLLAEEERLKTANHALKLQLIDQLKALTESRDDFNKLYNEFKDIQQRWKEIKAVPQEVAGELWRNYQVYNERFYDIIKINNQFRDYDFKKNFELKTVLCETVEKLEEEPDVVSAFHQLQKLHQQWREIGPVAKENREEIWTRFKAASTVVNKRHQQHFDDLKGKEQDNLEAKTAICEEIERIDYNTLVTFRDWEEKNKEVISLQEKWKSIGFAPKKYNVKIFERFRTACDTYFKNKSDFYKSIKDEMERNLELKKALCEKAEAIKESQEWKETTEIMISLQKEWKTIGSVARKHSDAIWKRFISACDYYFAQKNKNVTSQKSVEQANLASKKAIIEKIKTIDQELPREDALALLKSYMGEWGTFGFVPFRDKDKIYKDYHEAVDKQFERLHVDRNDRKMQSFKESISDLADGGRGKGRLYSEREKLMRMYDRMKNELQTYENNIGFLSFSSKGGGGVFKEMERKIEKLKEDMNLIVKKIDAIDENLE